MSGISKEYGQELIDKFLRWIDDEDFMEDEFKKDFSFFKRELNVLKVCMNDEMPGAKFEVGEFVYDCKYTKGEKNDNEIVQIGNRSYTENRGWVYSINYSKVDKEKLTITGGGSSCWWNEKDFQKIDEPLLLLIIQKDKLESDQRKKESQLKQVERDLERLQYSLNIIRGIQQ